VKLASVSALLEVVQDYLDFPRESPFTQAVFEELLAQGTLQPVYQLLKV